GNMAQAVHMPLDEVSAEAVTQLQGTLQIDTIPRTEFAQVRASQRLRPRLETERLGVALHYGQAGAVDGHTFTDDQISRYRRLGNGEMPSGAVGFHAADSTQSFHQASKHKPSGVGGW